MAGFEWNKFFTTISTKLKKAYPECTVDRYNSPKETQFPYTDIALSDISGRDYDLEGNEGAQTPMVTITTYATGSLADNTCYTICRKAKEIMLKHGWQCMAGPIPVANAANPNISRWTARFKRIVADGDDMEEITEPESQ